MGDKDFSNDGKIAPENCNNLKNNGKISGNMNLGNDSAKKKMDDSGKSEDFENTKQNCKTCAIKSLCENIESEIPCVEDYILYIISLLAENGAKCEIVGENKIKVNIDDNIFYMRVYDKD